MSRSLVAIRKEHDAVCPTCGSPDYTIYTRYPDPPKGVCGSCGRTWPVDDVHIKCETQESALAYQNGGKKK